MGRKKYKKFVNQSKCRYCRENMSYVDYKDIDTLSKLTTNQGKIFSKKRSGNCARHQRMAEKAIKRARILGLLPFMG